MKTVCFLTTDEYIMPQDGILTKVDLAAIGTNTN